MEIIIYDHQIFAVNRNKAENFSDSLVYKAKDGLHQIDFEECEKTLEKSIQQTIIGALVKEISKKDIFFYILTACKLKSFFGKLLYFLFKIIFYTEQDKNVF